MLRTGAGSPLPQGRVRIMASVSQENLLRLAQRSEQEGKTQEAVQELEEAIGMGHDLRLTLHLSRLYRKSGREDQAYALIKEEPDLFSDSALFCEYQAVLAANHFAVEAAELEHLRGKKLNKSVRPASAAKQEQIMKSFRTKQHVNLSDYQQLLKLSESNFRTFAQSLLLDPSQGFAVRLSLCEDLVRLGGKSRVNVLVLGKMDSFVPDSSLLLEKETVYREIVSAMADRYRKEPAKLPLMLGEVNLVLGSLYPRLDKYVDEPDAFASDLASYLDHKDGRGHQDLFDQIYARMPRQ